MPVVNNPIRSKIPWPNIKVNFTASPAGDWQTGCLWWEVVESRFHVDLKSNFAMKNYSMEFLLCPITRRINVLYEPRMKWTWHHSKLAVEKVSFSADSEWYSFNYYLYTMEQSALRTWVWCSCAPDLLSQVHCAAPHKSQHCGYRTVSGVEAKASNSTGVTTQPNVLLTYPNTY